METNEKIELTVRLIDPKEREGLICATCGKPFAKYRRTDGVVFCNTCVVNELEI